MLAIAALLVAGTLPALVRAETVSLAPGSFEVPDGLQVLDRSEDVNPKTGKAEGMIVFSRKGDVPRAVFIVTYLGEDGTSEPTDPRDAAVKIGNPFDPALGAKDARDVPIGGVVGATYSGTLPNGLVARSYVVSNNGYRLVVLLKGPDAKPYAPLMESFAEGFEHFSWVAPPAPAAQAGGT